MLQLLKLLFKMMPVQANNQFYQKEDTLYNQYRSKKEPEVIKKKLLKSTLAFNEKQEKEKAYQFYKRLKEQGKSTSKIQLMRKGTSNQYTLMLFDISDSPQDQHKTENKQPPQLQKTKQIINFQQEEQEEQQEEQFLDDLAQTYLDVIRPLMIWNQNRSVILSNPSSFLAQNKMTISSLKNHAKYICNFILFYQNQFEKMLLPQIQNKKYAWITIGVRTDLISSKSLCQRKLTPRQISARIQIDYFQKNITKQVLQTICSIKIIERLRKIDKMIVNQIKFHQKYHFICFSLIQYQISKFILQSLLPKVYQNYPFIKYIFMPTNQFLYIKFFIQFSNRQLQTVNFQ